jgi:hypothetical protein
MRYYEIPRKLMRFFVLTVQKMTGIVIDTYL